MAPESEQTIKVASKKDANTGSIKLKKPPPKHSKPGNWRDGSVVEGASSEPSSQQSPVPLTPMPMR